MVLGLMMDGVWVVLVLHGVGVDDGWCLGGVGAACPVFRSVTAPSCGRPLQLQKQWRPKAELMLPVG
uniref:Secreted protein n=1 Tax=Knipowitschia caucasica TaxID=637954 RepID=A0AAV2JII2_KNICA